MHSRSPSPVSSDDDTPQHPQRQHAHLPSHNPTVTIRSSAASVGGGGGPEGWRPGTMVDLMKKRRRSTERQEQGHEHGQLQQHQHQQEDRQQQRREQQRQEHEIENEEKEVNDEEEEEEVEEEEEEHDDAPPQRQTRVRERIRVSVTAATIGGLAPSERDATDDNEEGEWFLGKYTSKAFRRGAKHLLGLVSEESKRRKDGAPVVGTLTLTFKGTRGLGGEDGEVVNPYFEVWCEGTKKLIKPKASQGRGGGGGGGGGDGCPASPLAHPGTDKEWRKTKLQFEVTDITTDVHVLLLDKRPIRTLTVGRLILPLPNFLGYHHPLPPRTCAFDLLAAELIDGGHRPHTTKRLLSQKYVPQMKSYTPSSLPSSLPSSEEGVVGQVILEVALQTPHNLFHTYLASRPLLEDSFSTPRPTTSAATAAAAEEKATAAAAADLTIHMVDLRTLAINIFRLKTALLPAPLLLLLLNHPLFFLPLFTYLLLAPTWALPLHLSLLLLVNGALSSSSSPSSASSPPPPSFPPSFPALEICPVTPPSSLPPSSSSHPIELWPHGLVERVLQMEAYSAPKKIRRLINLVRWTQDFLGIISSLLERASYLFSWADPHVTLPVAVCVMVGSLLMSLVLYVVTPVVVVWCVGVGIYMVLRRLVKYIKDAAAAATAAAAAAAAGGGRREEKKGKGQRIEEEEEEEGGEEGGEGGEVEEEAVYKVLEMNWKDWVGDPRKSFIPNVLARTPDALDVLHREIARRRVHEEKMGGNWSWIDNEDDVVKGGRRKVE